ncbi:putative Radiation sensitive 17 [Tripterygium wilfordii]|uniref:Putative Radiation sensitive 17 n=1 Tax=Tripterygium wilfordii TaxID=458696 RepID=A0A7J7CVG8_TRIWF|nr:cell cycle checkpoint protein RAD17 [Tripterygium wilfordii]KAF5738112.1 putative Radiation sensitive 17 [Tripterygium wilfordii]
MVMGKRNTVVVLSSSDDEDYVPLLSSKRSYSKPNSRSLVTRTEPRAGKKKRRISDSSSRLCVESSYVDEIRSSFQDFDEVISGSKVSTGFGRNNKKELWIDKYQPRSLEELAVHKKKIEEVKVWFEGRLTPSKDELSNHVLLISGQAGVGKSATIHVIASHLGARVCEWNTPTPTAWQEHVHNFNSGIQYRSKLDEFETFVEKVRKYGLLPSSFPVESKSSIILLIDDLPMTNGRAAFEKLQNCLFLLVTSVQTPTAILVTANGHADPADQTTRLLEELQSSLETAGACKVAFNPITYNSIKKTLTRICREEHCNLSDEQIGIIAKSSGGDIRHAITSLQLFVLKPDLMHRLSPSDLPSGYSKERTHDLNALDGGFSLHFGRDETLSLFHALGKFLHNKRETENTMALDGNAFDISEKFSRLPLKMDAPEKILCQAHGQSRPITDFLHENALDFLSEEAMDDAWGMASYLSDADLLLASFRGMLARYNEAEGVLQSASASVSVRGVLFGNSHPLRSRWHAIRRPKLWQVEQSTLQNKKEIVRQRFTTPSFCDLSVIATEYTPVSNWLGLRTSGALEDHQMLIQSSGMVHGDIEKLSLDDHESEISGDEIEDWD